MAVSVLMASIYFFLSVKKLRLLGSSLRSPEAGSVWERDGPADAACSHCSETRLTHAAISSSSRACKRSSAPFANLR